MFGSLLFLSIIRFWMKGWIEELYIKPAFFFPFYGFEFIQPLGNYTYLLFIVCAVSAGLVAVGLFYRTAIITLFMSFTYIELIDKTTYLNHYYFISMICLLMIFLPANVYFSLDAKRHHRTIEQIPAWCTDSVKLFICLVYVFAGLAKINSDWLLHALPLRIWLPSKNDLPLIGPLFNKVWVAYAFSWAGCLYDLMVPFLLLYRPSRVYAYMIVIIFHVSTAILFPIGMFPYIMIGTAIIFFSPEFHSRIINRLRGIFGVHPCGYSQGVYSYRPLINRCVPGFLILFFVSQVILPLRFLAYPGKLAWNEEGYRFSWRVMLMEKTGYAQFTVRDSPEKYLIVNNNDFLTPLQEKMMAAQPDMILQYAHMLRDYYKQHGFNSPEVYVESYVTVNGRLGKPMIGPDTNLAGEEDSFIHKQWILPFEDDIKDL